MLQGRRTGEQMHNACSFSCRWNVIDRTSLIWSLFWSVLMQFLLTNDRMIILHVNRIIISSRSLICQASRLCANTYSGSSCHPQNLTMLPSVSSTFYLPQLMSQRVFALRKIRRRTKWEHMEERSIQGRRKRLPVGLHPENQVLSWRIACVKR